MATIAVTQDALELMVQMNTAIRELSEVVVTLVTRVEELKVSTMTPALVTEAEAAEYIGMSVHFLRKSRSEGKIGDRTPPPGHLEVGGAIRYEKKELDRWVAEDAPRKHYPHQRPKAA